MIPSQGGKRGTSLRFQWEGAKKCADFFLLASFPLNNLPKSQYILQLIKHFIN